MTTPRAVYKWDTSTYPCRQDPCRTCLLPQVRLTSSHLSGEPQILGHRTRGKTRGGNRTKHPLLFLLGTTFVTLNFHPSVTPSSGTGRRQSRTLVGVGWTEVWVGRRGGTSPNGTGARGGTMCGSVPRPLGGGAWVRRLRVLVSRSGTGGRRPQDPGHGWTKTGVGRNRGIDVGTGWIFHGSVRDVGRFRDRVDCDVPVVTGVRRVHGIRPRVTSKTREDEGRV